MNELRSKRNFKIFFTIYSYGFKLFKQVKTFYNDLTVQQQSVLHASKGTFENEKDRKANEKQLMMISNLLNSLLRYMNTLKAIND